MRTWVVPDTLPAAIDDDETIAIVSGAKVGVIDTKGKDKESRDVYCALALS